MVDDRTEGEGQVQASIWMPCPWRVGRQLADRRTAGPSTSSRLGCVTAITAR